MDDECDDLSTRRRSGWGTGTKPRAAQATRGGTSTHTATPTDGVSFTLWPALADVAYQGRVRAGRRVPVTMTGGGDPGLPSPAAASRPLGPDGRPAAVNPVASGQLAGTSAVRAATWIVSATTPGWVR